MSIKHEILFVLFSIFFIKSSFSQKSHIQINPTIKRFIGNVSNLDRSKYFNIHAGKSENDSDFQSFYSEYKVTPSGRTFWGPGINALNASGVVGVYNNSIDLQSQEEWWADDTWYVDISKEIIYILTGWKRAIWQKPFALSFGDSLFLETDIFINGTFIDINSTVCSFGFQNISVGKQEGISYNQVYLSTQAWGGGKIVLRSNNNTELNQVVCLNQSEIVGDTIRVQVKLKLGDNANNSTVSARLINISDSDSSNWGYYQGIGQELFDTAISDGVFFFMNTGSMAEAGVSRLNITKIGVNGFQPSLSTTTNGDNSVKSVSRYVATEHPKNVYKEGIDKESLADWVVRYFTYCVDSLSRPEFYEPMNEPFVHARDFYDEPDWDPVAETRVKTEMAQVYKVIGEKIHKSSNLSKMKVVGYAAAWPAFEKNDFSQWDSNMKMFMDTAGEYMDAFSTHLYDGINVVGQDSKRCGSNQDAILDLIETYSYSKWNIIKPHAITEFGGGISGEQYDDILNMQSVRSQNALLFGLLEREDRMEIAIPFTTGKDIWHITAANNYLPYPSVLWKPVNIGVPVSEITGWEYTNRILFYELWKDVEGERVLFKTDNPDIQVQAFVDGQRLYLALNNLDDYEQDIDLAFLGDLPSLNQVRMKSLVIPKDSKSNFNDQYFSVLPQNIVLCPGETIVMECQFENTISHSNTLYSKRYYTSKHLQNIESGQVMTFNFNDVDTGTGYAWLSMSIGRNHNLSKTPQITVNGKTVTVSPNWKGDSQLNRDVFFGTIEIPVPMRQIEENNEVSVKFSDSGGRLSSMILNVEKYENTVTAIDELRYNENIQLYPNPAKTNVFVQCWDPIYKIEVFDEKGILVFSQKTDNNINLSSFSQGIYIVKVYTNKGSKYSNKLVVL